MNAPRVAAAAERTRVLRGMTLLLTAVALFAFMDAISKYLTRFYPVMMIVWMRYVFHTLLIIVALVPRRRRGFFKTRRAGLQLLRGFLLVGASLFFVASLAHMPLAEASAISFLAPILVTILGVVVLGEKVEFARWLAVVGGFVGVLVVVRPGSGVFSWGGLLPLGTAGCFASYQVLTRHLAGVDSPYTSLFYSGLVGTLVLSSSLLFSWVAPQSAFHLVLFVLIGALGGTSHLILTKAYDQAPASKLAPFSYTQLVWASLAGYLFFGDFPDRWSLAGIVILVGSGVYIARHQHLNARA